jgi:FHS family L-fucose permease-like MFS transporter
VQVPYFGIAALLLALSAVMWLAHLPEPEIAATPATERGQDGKDNLWQHKALWFGVIAIFVYVGAEVSIGSFLTNYIASPHISTMTTTEASRYLSFYWGGAMVGRFLIGAIMMRYVAPSKMLADNCIAAIVLVGISIATQGALSMWAILLVGLCNSIMFPTIFTLAIRGLGRLTGFGSGLLVAAIFGGAVLPMLQGAIADHVGLTASFAIPVICYGYIWLYGVTIFARDKQEKRA